jgi:hypothetical protein
MRIAAGIIGVIAILGSGLWFYHDPGFEPAITTLAGIAALLWSLPSRKPGRRKEFSRQFEALKARWYAEKKLEPASLDDARWLLSQVLDYLNDLRVVSNEKYYREIDDLTYQAKSVQVTDIFLDGGVTYNKFWSDGSALVEKISSLLKRNITT